MEFNEVPAKCKTEPVVLGIDEAGRGPVLGSMVYACAYWPVSEDEEISKMGFDDSKALTEQKRDALFQKLKNSGRIGYVIRHLHSHEISAWMLQKVPYSLNAMSHDTAIDLVRKVVDMGVNVVKAFVDTVGDPSYYQTKLSKAFSHRIEFVVSSKADSLYKCVSAASICAKVSRDRVLRNWTFKETALNSICTATDELTSPSADMSVYDVDSDVEVETALPAAKRARSEGAVDVAYSTPSMGSKLHPKHAGSGYPGDPLTKRWLKDNLDPVFGWPSVVRFSWSTCKDMATEQCAKVDWEDSDGEEGEGKNQSKLMSFFGASRGPRAGLAGRHKYFANRGMSLVADL